MSRSPFGPGDEQLGQLQPVGLGEALDLRQFRRLGLARPGLAGRPRWPCWRTCRAGRPRPASPRGRRRAGAAAGASARRAGPRPRPAAATAATTRDEPPGRAAAPAGTAAGEQRPRPAPARRAAAGRRGKFRGTPARPPAATGSPPPARPPAPRPPLEPLPPRLGQEPEQLAGQLGVDQHRRPATRRRSRRARGRPPSRASGAGSAAPVWRTAPARYDRDGPSRHASQTSSNRISKPQRRSATGRGSGRAAGG